jgi:hypothetical protein
MTIEPGFARGLRYGIPGGLAMWLLILWAVV